MRKCHILSINGDSQFYSTFQYYPCIHKNFVTSHGSSSVSPVYFLKVSLQIGREMWKDVTRQQCLLVNPCSLM